MNEALALSSAGSKSLSFGLSGSSSSSEVSSFQRLLDVPTSLLFFFEVAFLVTFLVIDAIDLTTLS
jgi:hypothetical protein